MSQPFWKRVSLLLGVLIGCEDDRNDTAYGIVEPTDHVDTGYLDLDGDGHRAIWDCDDSDPEVNSDAEEICGDGIDNDCDGATDYEDDTCRDDDGDGYASYIDCDDLDPEVHPGAEEICDDGIDNDCDSFIDDRDIDCAK